MSQPFIGQVIAVGFNFAPVGWALCQGQVLSISENDALFALLGTTFGGDGQNTFGLPDLRGRTALGMGGGSGLSPYVLGQPGGVESVTLTSAQIGSHTHGLSAAATATTATPSSSAVLARGGDADLRDGRSWRHADGRRGVYGPGRRTAARKPAAEPDHKLHH
jgi:microcystin-dependent protein